MTQSQKYDPLIMFVVYENPSDYPGKFVVRRWSVGHGMKMDAMPIYIGDDLECARTAIPAGAYNLGRQPNDDAAILEVWA